MQITSATGNSGIGLKIDDNNRALVNSKSSSLQHIVSEEKEEAYQLSVTSSLASGTSGCVLNLKNTSTTKNIIITYIRLQWLSGATMSLATSYITVEKNRIRTANGVAATINNMNIGSANAAGAEAYYSPSAGTAMTFTNASSTSTVIDKWYPKALFDEQKYDKQGTLILKQDQELSIHCNSLTAANVAYARVSFIMESPEN